jgi:hypothetical protein
MRLASYWEPTSEFPRQMASTILDVVAFGGLGFGRALDEHAVVDGYANASFPQGTVRG